MLGAIPKDLRMPCYTSTGLQAPQVLETGVQGAGVISRSNGVPQSQGYNTGLSYSTILTILV